MKRFSPVLALLCLLMAGHVSSAQPPEDREDRRERRGGFNPLDRILALDQNDDGVLEKSEVRDSRMQQFFDRGDRNQDGKLTREELQAMFRDRFAGGGPRRGGFGPDRFGPGGPPKPGTILPEFLQDALELDVQQREKLEELQAQVNAQLKEILSPAQWERLESGEGLFPGRGRRGGDSDSEDESDRNGRRRPQPE